MQKKEHKNAMNIVVRLLSRRNHTKHEIRQKLKQRGIAADVISYVISECERLSYVNDEQTGRFYIRELRSKGYGIRRIRMSMRQKGLENELVDKLLSEIHSETDEMESARRVMKKKRARFDREKDERKRREKIYRFLASRGFSSAVISQFIN